MKTWLRHLILGLQLAFSGGREVWLRIALTSLGIGFGVAMLLGAASIPTMLDHRHDRVQARDAEFIKTHDIPAGAGTMLVRVADETVQGREVRGVVLHAEGPEAPVPPGLSRPPGDGEMVVSPALAELLAGPSGPLLAPRLPYRTVGTIGDAGLTGPLEYAFYAGAPLTESDGASRIDHFGEPPSDQPFNPLLAMLVLVIFVVLLTPIAVFIGAAIRFGDERRERRLAAIRLLGTDALATRTIAGGEALLLAFAGLVTGGLMFAAVRPFAGRFGLPDVSTYSADVVPSAGFALLIVLAVPLAAIAITQLALRRVVIEPLGVTRRAPATRRRGLWWRIAMPVAGLGILYYVSGSEQLNPTLTGTGLVLVLVGVTILLPWLVQAVVNPLGGAGSVALQLAARRLQLDGAATARVVNAIAVAAAGGIALQMLFGAAATASTVPTGASESRFQATAISIPGAGTTGTSVPIAGATSPADVDARFAATPGVRSATSVAVLESGPVRSGPTTIVAVADCATFRKVAGVEACADGDVLVGSGDPVLKPGQEIKFGDVTWRAPSTTREAPLPTENMPAQILITPAAAGDLPLDSAGVFTGLHIDAQVRNWADNVRNTAARTGTNVYIPTDYEVNPEFAAIQRALLVGVVLVLLLVGASTVVSTVEQLQQQRKLLAAMIAVGTPRGVLTRSVCWQTALPTAIGAILALGAGLGLGAVLLKSVEVPVHIDWPGISVIAGGAVGVIALALALTLPVLWRLLRSEGLRTE